MVGENGHIDISKSFKGIYGGDKTIKVADLINLITKHQSLDGELVIRFYDDYYTGIEYEGVVLRKPESENV